MKNNLYNDLIMQLKSKNISFSKGLSEEEIQQIETIFEFHFPPDLKNFLQTALPISRGFPNWRAAINSENEKAIVQNKLNWPLESILRDLEDSEYWNPSWGIKTLNIKDRKVLVTNLIKASPKLIPIFMHRYIPDQPNQKNNPVFSVYGIDTITYGNNLVHYLANEFQVELPVQFYTYLNEIKEIDFWTVMSNY